MLTILNNVMRKRDGATAIEYGLIAALIALVIIAGATALGNSINAKFNSIATSVSAAGGGGAAGG